MHKFLSLWWKDLCVSVWVAFWASHGQESFLQIAAKERSICWLDCFLAAGREQTGKTGDLPSRQVTDRIESCLQVGFPRFWALQVSSQCGIKNNCKPSPPWRANGLYLIIYCIPHSKLLRTVLELQVMLSVRQPLWLGTAVPEQAVPQTVSCTRIDRSCVARLTKLFRAVLQHRLTPALSSCLAGLCWGSACHE